MFIPELHVRQLAVRGVSMGVMKYPNGGLFARRWPFEGAKQVFQEFFSNCVAAPCRYLRREFTKSQLMRLSMTAWMKSGLLFW